MLAKPTKAITEVLDRFEGKRFTCEYKYDGERAQVGLEISESLVRTHKHIQSQVHKLPDGRLCVFSRNSEDMSAKYPDLFEQLPKVLIVSQFIFTRILTLVPTILSIQAIKTGTESFVLDCEAVAFDRETNKLLPFQELSKRKRKDVKAEDVTVKVCLFAFDLLYLNGEVSFSLPRIAHQVLTG